MNRALSSLFAAFLLAGCTPTQLLQPTIPAVPPEKPAELKRKADADKQRGPISPDEVNERNARCVLRELDAELQQSSERE